MKNILSRIGIVIYAILLVGIPFYDVFIYHNYEYTGLFSLWKAFLSFLAYIVGWWFILTPCFWIISSSFFLENDELDDMKKGCFYPAIALMLIFAVIFVYNRCKPADQSNSSDNLLKNSLLYDSKDTGKDIVYICTGHAAKKYHNSRDCRWLSNCSGEIKEITIENAHKQGKTPCKGCY